MSSAKQARPLTALLLVAAALAGCGGDSGPGKDLDPQLVAQGKEIFRFDTFGDDSFWTDTLGLHKVIQAGVSPATALRVGLKVDASALPAGILETADLNDPATTVALLKLNAVVGVKGVVQNINGKDSLVSIGITCAFCHSTVDNSVAPGIGQRLDGWPNRDLNVGAIVALSPALQDLATQAVLTSWGPGMYDAYWNHDGLNHPTVIPPAYGLHNVALETFTGEGPVGYWNAYVAVTQMHGHGNFDDPKLGIHIVQTPDMVTSKLLALGQYQFSIPAPAAPAGSFDVAAAQRGKDLFSGKARCNQCHTGSSFTDAGKRLHAASEVGVDPTLAERATTGFYRTTPLRGAWQHPPYFHDGSMATLADVVQHFDSQFGLRLTPDEQQDIVEYLKSL